MYFQDRKDAANRLASSLSRYTDDDVVVASEIGAQLRSRTTTLISKALNIPGERQEFGSVDQAGKFSYNSALTEGERDHYEGEYHNVFEAEKIKKSHDINVEISKRGLFSRDEFLDKIVILVADGLDETSVLDSSLEYLKPVRLKKLVAAVPVASVAAVDRMHITCDEIHCLSVTENYLSADHYYDDTREK
jgi:putative phosphoribosyl transferase